MRWAKVAAAASLLLFGLWSLARVMGPRWLDGGGRPEARRLWLCQRNLEALGTGCRIYMADNDGRYPPSQAWCDALEPYVGDTQRFHCPAAQDSPHLSYAYNAQYSARREAELRVGAYPVVVFEWLPGAWNQSLDRYEPLPPAPRHREGSLGLGGNGQVAIWSTCPTDEAATLPRGAEKLELRLFERVRLGMTKREIRSKCGEPPLRSPPDAWHYTCFTVWFSEQGWVEGKTWRRGQQERGEGRAGKY